MNSQTLAVVALSSFWGSALLVITERFHRRWTADHGGTGIQKHHTGSPSRIGGLPLVLAMGLGVWLWQSSGPVGGRDMAEMVAMIMVASLPVWCFGLADDIFKIVSPRARIVGAAISSVMAMMLLDVRITHIGVPGLDALVALWPVSVVLTVLMVCGFTNAMNLVDGLNGLAAGLALLMATATGVLAWGLGDALLLDICWLLGAALIGFLAINWPRGALFLGDGGAYFIGFSLAQIWILLIARHQELSPWIVMAIAFHPTMETIFSIARRRWLRRSRGAAMAADRLHLHSLIYRRGTLQRLAGRGLPRWVANASAAVITLVFATVPMVLAVLGPSSTSWGALVVGMGVVAYLWVFRRFVTFSMGVAPAPAVMRSQLPRLPGSAR